MNGRQGSSGGGADAGTNTSRGTHGVSTAIPLVLGNAGGGGSNYDPGGGGAAGGVGGDATSSSAGAGSAGWVPSANDAVWIETAAGVAEFSHGGAGGKQGATSNPPAANYGDGGAASSSDRAGPSGIVVIRFPYTAP